MKRSKKKLKKKAILAISLGIVATVTLSFLAVSLIRPYPSHMVKKDLTDKEAGDYKIEKKTVNENLYVFHYPKTSLNPMDSWIKEKLDETLSYYDALVKDKEIKQEIKIDYKSYESFDSYTAVQLNTYLNGELVNSESKTYDGKNKAFLNLEILKPEVLRLLTHDVRESYTKDKSNRETFLQETLITSEFDNILLKGNTLKLYAFDNELELNLEENPEYLLNDFETIKSTDGIIPSVYLDYGYSKDDKLIAFTFDDGPYPEYGYEFMKTLEKYDAKGTFYVLGSRIGEESPILKDLTDNGHQVAIHSDEHVNFNNMSAEQVKAQIERAKSKINKVTGMNKDYYVRPPYGNLTQELKDALPYTFTNWSIDSEDWKSRNAQTVCDLTMRYVQDGDIILMHELYSSTLESLDCILPKLQAEGYKFVTVEELLEVKMDEVKVNTMYYSAN